MAWYFTLAVIAAGFVAGFANTLAGSGSLVTLPLLIFLGLPPTVANGTNRVAVLLQNAVAAGSFQRKGLMDMRRGLAQAVPAVAGAFVGARLAAVMNEEIMRRTIGGLMLAMLALLLVKPDRWLHGRPEAARRAGGLSGIAVFFFIGVYGGFVQAGVGVFLLAALVLGVGYDLLRGNAVKVLIIFCLTACALAVFVAEKQVVWGVGLVLAAGNMLGAWVAAKFAVAKGAEFVRWVLIVVVACSAAALLV